MPSAICGVSGCSIAFGDTVYLRIARERTQFRVLGAIQSRNGWLDRDIESRCCRERSNSFGKTSVSFLRADTVTFGKIIRGTNGLQYELQALGHLRLFPTITGPRYAKSYIFAKNLSPVI
jgi:hypothetical protein